MAMGMDMLSSVERVNQSVGLAAPPEVDAQGNEVPTAAENDKAMAALSAAMKGLGV